MIRVKRFKFPRLLVLLILIFSFTFVLSDLSALRAVQGSSGYKFQIYTTNNNQIYNPPVITNFAPNSTVVVEGSICPNPIIGIGNGIYANVTYTKPDGTNFTHSALLTEINYCSGGGDLVDSISPSETGTWKVSALAIIDWGNGTMTEVKSNEAVFTVGSSAGPFGTSASEFVLISAAVVVIAVIAVLAFVFLRKRVAGRELPPPPSL